MIERSLIKEQESRYIKAIHPHLDIKWTLDASLKPCPFCGFTPKLYQGFTPFGDDEANVYLLECAECDISWVQLWECDYIVDKWNYRADEGGDK